MLHHAAAVAIVVAAQAWPNGFDACSLNGPTVPRPAVRDDTLQAGIGLACTEDGQCSVSATQQFNGFVVTVAPPYVVAAVQNEVITRRSKTQQQHCLTHTSRDAWLKPQQDAVTFKIQRQGGGGSGDDERARVFVTVVAGKKSMNGAKYHVYGAKAVEIAAGGAALKAAKESAKRHVHIVGAGPGGLGAARYLSEMAHFDNYTVYEKGGFMQPAFWQAPIAATGHFGDSLLTTPLKYNAMDGSLDDTAYVLGMGVGGTQNINGAVYAPGTPKDLAASVGVSEEEAALAQRAAATFVEHTEDGMMWACLKKRDCDRQSLANTNMKMARRSAAYNLSAHTRARIRTQSAVQRVTNKKIVLQNGEVVAIGGNDVVILAAGALTSPQLLGRTAFAGNNHYYNTTTHVNEEYPYDAQRFTYQGDYEFNDAKINDDNWMTIQMEMNKTNSRRKEVHVVGRPYDVTAHPTMTQAWHFAGTMPHNARLQVEGYSNNNIYTGDAGALMSPFNCHTSMPAVAVGVMAARSAMGWQTSTAAEIDVPPVQVPLQRPMWPVYMYVAAVFAAVLGVACHASGLRKAHYCIMAIAYALMLVPTLFLASSFSTSVANEAHKVGGYVVVVWMTLQMLYGAMAAQQSQSRWFQKGHRASGYALLAVICAQTWTAKTGAVVYFNATTLQHAVAASYSALFEAVVVAALVVVSVRQQQVATGLSL